MEKRIQKIQTEALSPREQRKKQILLAREPGTREMLQRTINSFQFTQDTFPDLARGISEIQILNNLDRTTKNAFDGVHDFPLEKLQEFAGEQRIENNNTLLKLQMFRDLGKPIRDIELENARKIIDYAVIIDMAAGAELKERTRDRDIRRQRIKESSKIELPKIPEGSYVYQIQKQLEKQKKKAITEGQRETIDPYEEIEKRNKEWNEKNNIHFSGMRVSQWHIPKEEPVETRQTTGGYLKSEHPNPFKDVAKIPEYIKNASQASLYGKKLNDEILEVTKEKRQEVQQEPFFGELEKMMEHMGRMQDGETSNTEPLSQQKRDTVVLRRISMTAIPKKTESLQEDISTHDTQIQIAAVRPRESTQKEQANFLERTLHRIRKLPNPLGQFLAK